MGYDINKGIENTQGQHNGAPTVPQLITIYIWSNRQVISMGIFSSMVRFNSKLLTYKLYITLWTMIWIRVSENRQGQQNDSPRVP